MKRKVPCLKTVGELKRALQGIPDDMPLAVDDHGIGWGLKPPFIATHSWQTMEHGGYCSAQDAVKPREANQASLHKLSHPVCVIQPGTEHL